jgi:hypothetical protein
MEKKPLRKRIRPMMLIVGGAVLILLAVVAFLWPNQRRSAIAAIEADGGLLNYKSSDRGSGIFSRFMERLKFWNNSSSDISNVVIASDNTIKYFAAFPEVEELHLNGPNVTDEALLSLKDFPQITSLRISRTSIKGTSFGELRKLPRLRRLYIAQPAISAEMIDALNAVAPMPEKLSAIMPFATSGNEDSEAASKLSCRWYITLGTSDISDETLSRLKKLPVAHLTIRGSSISDRGMESLVELPVLTQLDLLQTDITDEGLRHIGRIQQLNTLDLWDASITDAGLDYLGNSKSLSFLALSRTKVTNEGVSAFHKKHRKIAVSNGDQFETN